MRDQQGKDMTDINAEDGILRIRKIVGAWLSKAGQLKARDAMGRISAIILDIASPIEINPAAAALVATAQALEDRTANLVADAIDNPPTHFAGLTPAKPLEIIQHLENLIQLAATQPGDWTEGLCAGGEIGKHSDGLPFDGVGKLKERRDALLVIDTINALPKLLERITGAERGERSADAEVDRLLVLLEDRDAFIAKVKREVTSLQAGTALGDVAAERERQMSGEGCTPQRDDQYRLGDLANAAACYAVAAQALPGRLPTCPPAWPWPLEAWKPRSRRENLVRSGALILAEIERIDRAAAKAAVQEEIPDADDGWIKWDNSEWPGPSGIYSTQLVWVLLEDDQTPRPGFAKDFDWRAEPAMARSRIIAYRLTEPGKP